MANLSINYFAIKAQPEAMKKFIMCAARKRGVTCDAAHEFRFAFGCSDSRISQFLPQAVMLCSDGVDKVHDDLQEVLSYFSRKTTGDDMSVAVVVNGKTDRSEIRFQTD